VIADLDLDALHRIRAELPALQHRRRFGVPA
jgi:predicted amidohydrolase